MKIRYYLLALLVVALLGIGSVFLLPAPEYKPNLTQINDVAALLAENMDQIKNDRSLLPASSYDYAVIDAEGNLIQATREGLSESVYAALKNGDIIVDIVQDGQLAGKVIFAHDAKAQWQAYRTKLQIMVAVILVVMLALVLALLYTMHAQVLRPFRSLKSFAGRIAAGELDAPLKMEKRNPFGAFTESFDLMRDELNRARANEQAAERSKRELVASLSHDIQTPVSSIKAVAEVMELTAEPGDAEKLKTIQDKATQINTLVTELFHTTLEELNSLSVKLTGVPSNHIAELVHASDYLDKVRAEAFPGCLVQADPVRLSQVLDNIIMNSYKYADTAIWVSAELDDGGFTLTLRDEGPGVAEEELPLLCSKYFRGSSAEAKDGYGLGLFIAHHLIERMGGRLECFNVSSGFAVRIWLGLDE
ncbi:MAG: HAMP domain-containing histidine kinase [Coriobacteriia bacterium]|nr:HAMP domain-containing histidine kinase [Coriobacteriia bacterium]MCL2749859.1 HAMP domain-containing histidine kinase [Coriobacteriia bacterium]